MLTTATARTRLLRCRMLREPPMSKHSRMHAELFHLETPDLKEGATQTVDNSVFIDGNGILLSFFFFCGGFCSRQKCWFGAGADPHAVSASLNKSTFYHN